MRHRAHLPVVGEAHTAQGSPRETCPMARLNCPACGHVWETIATSACTRCGSCGGAVYVPVHLRRRAADPYPVSCPCGHRWWSTSSSGRTRCRSCGERVYVPAADRGAVLRPPRQSAPPAPRRVPPDPPRAVVATSPRAVPSPPPRAVPPDPLSALVDALIGGATRQAVPAAPARSPETGRRGGALTPARAVSAPAMGGQADPRIVPPMRCPTCGTGVARCGLALCPMPDGP
jgi:hypothetical protein